MEKVKEPDTATEQGKLSEGKKTGGGKCKHEGNTKKGAHSKVHCTQASKDEGNHIIDAPYPSMT
jgi:hypothetical protein